jgi:PAS domain S-box-containing protein
MMEKINILNLINFEEVNKLLEGFNQSTGFVTAILDLEGNVLSKSGWRQICTQFHRIHPETSKNCTISDTVLANKLGHGEKYHFYKCLNGLVDVAVPVIIKGQHIANLFSGQFFFEEPNLTFFKKQAGKYGFNPQEYLKTLENVPVVSKEKVKLAMDFLLNMTQLISEITYQKLEQIELNEALRKSEERLQDIIFSSADWVWEVDKYGRYTYSSQKSVDFFEVSEEEIIGKTPFDLMPEEEAKRVAPIFAEIVEKKEPIKDLENWNIGKNGELICLLTNGLPIFNEEEEFVGYRRIDKNITERKLFERELIKAKEKAEESDKLKSAFLANMSHEIRTPMNGILGFSSLLKEPELSGEQQQEYIQIIEKSGARMISIINDIISISKIESGIIDTHL